MVKEEMNDALLRVRLGQMSFDAFARASLENWRGRARGLLRAWKVPAWLTLDDVVQDLLIAAWRLVAGWNPLLGTTIEEFVVWNAVDIAKKRIHKARLGKRPHRGEEKMRSCFERPASSMGREGEEESAGEHIFDRLAAPSDQHETLVLRRACGDAKASSTTMQELIAVQAIEVMDGDVIAAASLLYEDVDARFICELGSERQAMTVACDAAFRVVRLAGAAA